ncbi:monooxygenase, partial [Rhizoctonia solani AG-3 Rhs1AP]
MADTNKVLDIVIIGAGVGGLTAAIMLQNSNYHNYTIYEMASDIGGTWHQNDYPGCACDIPAHWYSAVSQSIPTQNWSCLFASRGEIKQYWKRLAQKHNVESHIKFNTEFVSAVWNEKEQHYTLKLRDSKTKESREVKAKLVMSAVGVFNHPRWPDIPGREEFQGKLLHAQMWDYNVELSGKRVGLIGNGCAGSQILPVISEDSSTTVVNFCRTPSWYIPRPQMQVSPVIQWIFRHVPFALKSLRYTLAGACELLYHHYKDNFLSNAARKLVEKAMLSRMRSLAPAKYHKYLTPNYPFGCKRVVFDPGYLGVLGRPNVDMEWDPIARITPHGIQTKSGKEHHLDVIAFATGFDISSSMTLDVTGTNGVRLQEYYDKEGGPTGFMGTTTPGFPNWITIFGPNSATGHASVIYMEELQINYILKLFKPVLEGKAGSIVPRADSTRKFNNWLQYNLKGHVWPSCHSWYRHDGSGKITSLWPGGNTHLWWSLRKPNWNDYEVLGAKNWVRKQRIFEVVASILRWGLLAAGAGALVLVKTGRWDEFVGVHGETIKDLFESLRARLL